MWVWSDPDECYTWNSSFLPLFQWLSCYPSSRFHLPCKGFLTATWRWIMESDCVHVAFFVQNLPTHFWISWAWSQASCPSFSSSVGYLTFRFSGCAPAAPTFCLLDVNYFLLLVFLSVGPVILSGRCVVSGGGNTAQQHWSWESRKRCATEQWICRGNGWGT